MAKLEMPVRVYMGELEEIINELKHLQTYKLFEGDDMVLVDCDKVVEIFADHLRAEILSDSTIEPERKKGKWIFYETENEKYDDIKCPFCKKTYTVDAYRIDDIGFTAEDFKFCPNCGSDMRGDQDD